MSEYTTETDVNLVGDGRYRSIVSPSWNIGDNPNGGYLLSVVLSAIRQAAGVDDALSVTAHYLRPGLAGADLFVDVDVVRSGRTLTSVRATAVQEGKERLLVTAALGTLAAADPDGPYSMTLDPPEMPSPDQCIDRQQLTQGLDLPILSRLDVRIHPDDLAPDPQGTASMRGWIRLKDRSEPDTRSLVLFADAFPPAVLSRYGSVGWVPTLELTAHVRAAPSPGWVQASFEVDDLRNGYLIESGTLWDSKGELVLRSRQLGLLRLS